MTKGFFAAAFTVFAIALLAPVSAWAQAQWGEPINTPDRFVVLASYNNQAVYDKETGLVWEQSRDSALQDWIVAQVVCTQKTVGNRKGWRLPTAQELASLVDPSAPPNVITLPSGNPFGGGTGCVYWSATSAYDPNRAWHVNFCSGIVYPTQKASNSLVWCVRGGQGVNPQ
jgi:hypothetical protein